VTGTLINVAAVLAGTVAGVAAGSRLPPRIHRRVLAGLGLVTLVLGVDNALAWREGPPYVVLVVLGAVVLGGLLGEAVGIERRLEALAARLGRDPSERASSRASEGFVAATLLFCTGPLTVLGSIEDGLTGDYSTLATKAILDGFAAVALASTLGWGVGLAAASVLVIQGAIALAAGRLEGMLAGDSLAALTSAGGVLIIGIALKLLDVRDVKVGNFLPALVLAPLLVALVGLAR
jgi:uncharacterized membrane protein YqgA involved in biofilm formation